MIYIISGASRSGKSIVSKKLQKKLGISCLSTDTIMMGIINGIPEVGLSDKMWPDEIAKKIWPFLKAVMENLIYHEDDFILEGEAFLPSELSQFISEHVKDVKCCYMGYAEANPNKKISDIHEFSNGVKDWLVSLEACEISEHVHNMIGYSQKIKEECERYQLKYFENSSDFEKCIGEVIEWLTK